MSKKNTVSKRVGYLLKRAQHALRLRMDEALRALGVTTPQYAALSALEEGGARLSGAELARRCFVTPQTMNAIIHNLETSGLMARAGSSTHGRIINVSLTALGKKVVLRCHRVALALEEQMLRPLDAGSRQQLAERLVQCSRALENEK